MTEDEKKLCSINHAIKTIEKAESARQWLLSYGDNADFKVSSFNASACSGYKEAAELMSFWLRMHKGKFVEEMLDYLNDVIQENKDKIKSESEKL